MRIDEMEIYWDGAVAQVRTSVPAPFGRGTVTLDVSLDGDEKAHAAVSLLEDRLRAAAAEQTATWLAQTREALPDDD